MADRVTVKAEQDDRPAAESAAAPAAPPAAGIARPRRLSGADAYSAVVGVLKYLLPAIAVALILLVVAWPRFNRVEERLPIGIADLGLDQPSNSTMINARFDGIDDEGRPYRVTADQAVQRPGEEQLVDLENPAGDIMTDDETWIAIASKTGLYNKNKEVLDLGEGVTLFHDQGYEMHTESAKVYMNEGRVVGERPVDAQGPSGTIRSDGIRIEENGAVVVFTGRAQMEIYAGALEKGDGGAAPVLPDREAGE